MIGKENLFKKGASAFLVGSIALLAACGSPSSSSSSSSDTVDYSGSATITSSISVAESKLAEIEGTPSGRLITPADKRFSRLMLAGVESPRTVDGAEACLYELKANGSEVNTNICVDVADGEAVFNNIKDGIMYVIKVIKEGTEGNIEMETVANVPANATSVTTEVNEKTAAIREYVEIAITTAAEDASISLDSATFEFVLNIATQIVTDLIKNNEIDLDPVVKTDADRELKKQQEELAGASIEANDSMKEAQEDAQAIALLNADELTIPDSKRIINRLFAVLMGETIDGFFVDSFAEQHVNGKEITLEEFATAFHGSLRSDLPTVVSSYLTQSKILEILEDNIEEGLVKRIYQKHASQTVENTPTVAVNIFPAGDSTKWTDVTGATVMNVPQTLTVLLSNDKLMGNGLETDLTVPSDVREAISSITEDGKGDTLFDPVDMIIDIGFVELQVGSFTLSSLRHSTVVVDDWSSNQRVSKFGLELDVEVLYPEAKSVNKVELHYTNSSNQASVFELPLDHDYEDESNATQNINNVDASNFDQIRYRTNPWDRDNQGNLTGITDFKVGSATVKVFADVEGEETVVASQEITLQKFDIGNVRFITPRADQTLDSDESGELSNFTIKWKEPTANFDTTKYKLRYGLWVGLRATAINNESSIGTLPEAPDNAYSENDGWDYQHGGDYEERIYDSWDRVRVGTDNVQAKRHLSGDSFNLASRGITLSDTIRDVENNVQTEYSVGIESILLDEYGREVFRGGHDHVRFQVGTASDWEKALTVNVTFQTAPNDILSNTGIVDASGNVVEGTWKVAIVEKESWNQQTQEHIDNIRRSGSYQITPVVSNETAIVSEITGLNLDEADQTVEVTLPTISKSSNPIEFESSYTAIVWYDQTEAAPGVSGWSSYTPESPQENAVDGQDYFVMEFLTREGRFWRDHTGEIMYDGWDGEGPQSASYAEDTIIDITVRGPNK